MSDSSRTPLLGPCSPHWPEKRLSILHHFSSPTWPLNGRELYLGAKQRSADASFVKRGWLKEEVQRLDFYSRTKTSRSWLVITTLPSKHRPDNKPQTSLFAGPQIVFLVSCGWRGNYVDGISVGSDSGPSIVNRLCSSFQLLSLLSTNSFSLFFG